MRHRIRREYSKRVRNHLHKVSVGGFIVPADEECKGQEGDHIALALDRSRLGPFDPETNAAITA